MGYYKMGRKDNCGITFISAVILSRNLSFKEEFVVLWK